MSRTLQLWMASAFLLCFSALAHGQSVQDYARECTKAVGGAVPQFSCRQGALIPIKNYRSDKDCDNPAFLGMAGLGCNQHNRFGKLNATDIQPGFNASDIEIRFLCRHYLFPEAPLSRDKHFDDIAVIQTNKKTGATCFYQSPTGVREDMDGDNIPAPSASNARVITIVGPSGCVGCHNARAFINTPFLQGVPDPHKIPHPSQFNRDRYWFPGSENRDFKIFNITTGEATCTSCHNVASSNEFGFAGSSGSLGDQSVGNAPNPTTGDNKHAYMRIFAGSDPVNVLKKHQDCVSSPSSQRPAGCTVKDVSTAARQEYENGRVPTIPTPPVLSEVPVVNGGVYTLVGGYSAKCLDVVNRATNNGAKHQQWDCNGSNAQKFRFKKVQGDLWSFSSIDSGRCVSAEAAKQDNRTPMILWDCNNTADQLVRFQASRGGSFKVIWSHSNKCMDVQDTSADNGKAVFQYECVDVLDQDWYFRQADESFVPDAFDGKTFNLVGGFSNKCLDVINGASNNGAKLQQWDCNGSNAQKFRFRKYRDDLYTFSSVNSGRCVSAEAARMEDRTPMLLWDCKDSVDQLVRIQSSSNGSYKVIWSHSNKCMDVQDTSADNGKAVFQYQCVDVADQNWFFRPTN